MRGAPRVALTLVLCTQALGCLFGYEAGSFPGSDEGPGRVDAEGDHGALDGGASSEASTAGADAGGAVATAEDGGVSEMAEAGPPDAGTPDGDAIDAGPPPPPCETSSCWVHDGWSHRNRIRLASGLISGTDHVLFPVVISDTRSEWRRGVGGHVGQLDGGDIMFTTGDASEQLDHEIEFYSPLTGQLIVWVEVPLVSANETTELLMYYGNEDSSDQSSQHSTWSGGGNSGFRGVWHMTDLGSETRPDSTSRDNDFQTVNYEVNKQVFGQVAGSDQFDGIDDELRCPDSNSLDIRGDVTLSAWLRPSSRVATESWQNGPNKNTYGLYLYGANETRTTLGVDFWVDGIRYDIFDQGQRDLPPGEWVHVAATHDGSHIRAYVNGQLDYMVSAPGTLDNSATFPLTIGEREGEDGGLAAAVDEVRVSATARSADWLRTAYENQKDPERFAVIFEEEEAP